MTAHAPITPAPASETLNFAWQILSGEWMPCSFTRAEWIKAAEYAVDGDLADLDYLLDLDAQERPYEPELWSWNAAMVHPDDPCQSKGRAW